MIAESLLGGLLGFGGRILTAWLEFKDKDKDRDHEWRMLKAEQEIARQERHHQLQLGEQTLDVVQLQAIAESTKAQATPTGIGWVDAVNALVRPGITVTFMAMYITVKVCALAVAIEGGVDFFQAFPSIWTDNDVGIFSAIIAYWFANRELAKKGK